MTILTKTSVTINSLLSWSQSDLDTNNTANTTTDGGYFQYNPTWASGTGTGLNADIAMTKVWHSQFNLPSGGTGIYNVLSLPKTIFSGTYVLSFTGIQIFYCENLATGYTNGYNIALRATGTSGLTGLFNGSGNRYIPGGSMIMATNFKSGFPVTYQANTLFIVDGGSGNPIRLGFLGI